MAVVELKHLHRSQNRVYRVGIELEGAWLKFPDDIPLHRDGSVEGLVGPKDPITGFPIPLTVGEIHSEPIEPLKIRQWMKKYYPSHVNKTCGLHVHMSFKNARHYQWLMDRPDYQDTMVEYLRRWGKEEGIPVKHPLWSRLRGESTYCTLGYFPDEQARQKQKNYSHDSTGSRYTVINYCFGLHETLECRVLPMFEDPEVGIRAVRQVLDVTNAYLQLAGKKEPKLVAEVLGDGPSPKKDVTVQYA